VVQAQAKAPPKREAAAGPSGPRRRRALLYGPPLALLAWLALSHLVARPRVERWLQDTFAGEADVSWALVWPDLDVTAFGARVDGEHFTLAASRVRIGLNPWWLFGGRPIEDVGVHDLEAEVEEGAPLRLFRGSDDGDGGSGGEGDGVPRVDLDPTRYPTFDFHRPRVTLRGEEKTYTIFATDRVDVSQVGDRTFALTTGTGRLAVIPFEKMTARLIPRAGHLLLDDVKMRAFNGIVGGILDVNTDRAGAFNGELEGHFVEIEKIWEHYRLPFAEKRRGDLSGAVVFRGDRPSWDALQGKGTMQLKRAAFYSPLSFKVFLILKVPVAAEAPLTDAEMVFSFEQSLFYLEKGRANARDFHLDAQGIFAFDGACDLEVEHAGTTVAVTGQLEDPDVKVLPFDTITAPFHRIFRKRIGKK
jgi:hypothetical protein